MEKGTENLHFIIISRRDQQLKVYLTVRIKENDNPRIYSLICVCIKRL